MSVWGKVIGATAGFAVGGPIGALLGGIAGHVFDRSRGEDTGDATRQIAFTIGVIVLGAKMAKADGVVTRDEVEAFKEVFQIPPKEMKNVARVFDRARKDSGGFEPYARQVAGLFADSPDVLEDLLDGLFHIAKADNVMHPAEMDFLENVAAIFGFDDATFARIRESHVGPDAADPYRILGVTREASDDEIKSAYRNLVREHHPDTLIAQGLPEEFINIANGKLATINDAYDRIERERGLN